ncbi:UNVERIFIED_CONTAM: hypothetical protein RMT77_011818 [Armadillidium vulgare]
MTYLIIQCYIVTIIIIFVLNPVFGTQFTHDRKRVGPIDLVMAEQNCLKKFTVNENTIIRTQDSRLLGAKFLNESDIGNREDCLTFCCNTRFCDVAVFQEKSPFSCYLFDCGPPEDFLCKFTSHSYYTSAVLAVNRHQLDLGVWSSQFQHEAELTDLRYTPDNSKPSSEKSTSIQNKHPSSSSSSEEVKPSITETTVPPTTLPTTSPTTNTPSTSISTKSTVSDSQKGRKCSNFQFECHSGECIAIYNACDGIPQCKDGSDEGKELGCPQGVSSIIAANDSEAPKTSGGRMAVYNEDQWNGQSTPRRKYGQDRGIFNHRTNFLEYNHNTNDRSPDYAREESLGYGGHGKGPGGYYDYDQRQASVPKYNLGHPEVIKGDSPPLYHHDYPDYSLINRPREIQALPNPHPHQQIYPVPINQPGPSPRRSGSPQLYQQDDLGNKGQWQGQGQQYPPPYQGIPQNLQPHLQHYEGGLQGVPQVKYDPTRDMLQQQQTARYDNSRIESQQPFNSPLLQAKLQGSPPNTDAPPVPKASSQRSNGITNLPERAKHSETPSKEAVENPLTKTEEIPKSSLPSSTHSNQTKPTENGSDSTDKHSKDTNPETVSEEDKKTVIALKINDGDAVVAHASLSRLSVNIEELEREEEDQKSQTSGAILALSLGMIITALLIVLVGCKIRKVKKRVRRRKGLRSPLEHDVDYLVNGMYL